MAKAVKVEKKVFERVLRNMIGTHPAPLAKMPKPKEKLMHIVEPIISSR